MKRLLCISLVFVSSIALAQGRPCNEPEYYFLQTASKPELRDKYCSLQMRAKSNASDRQITREAIHRKQELRLDASRDQENELGELKAATSCEVAALAVAEAIERRFKSKRPSCN